MPDFENAEDWIRVPLFLGLLVVFSVAEALFPRRSRVLRRPRRWFANLSISILDSFVSRLILPAGAVGFAVLASARGWGLLNLIDAPFTFECFAAILALDAAIYAQHRIFHAIPLLWRLHRMHHSDVDLDVTSGVRFHPGEIALSLGIKCGVVAILGASPAAVLLFEALLNATSLFNHANLRLPPALDRALRLIVVTPDMHRVHHSVLPAETNSNFGFNVPWWDRLFGTYRSQPSQGHDAMTIGLDQFRDPDEQGLGRLLFQPMRNDR